MLLSSLNLTRFRLELPSTWLQELKSSTVRILDRHKAELLVVACSTSKKAGLLKRQVESS